MHWMLVMHMLISLQILLLSQAKQVFKVVFNHDRNQQNLFDQRQ